jgi:hypothetical protein
VRVLNLIDHGFCAAQAPGSDFPAGLTQLRVCAEGLRADHWDSGMVSVRQADRKLSGSGAIGGVERESTRARTHHETRQRAAAFPVGGCPSFGTQHSGVAHQYFYLAMRRGRKIAKVQARRLAVQMFWMWRKGWD